MNGAIVHSRPYGKVGQSSLRNPEKGILPQAPGKHSVFGMRGGGSHGAISEDPRDDPSSLRERFAT